MSMQTGKVYRYEKVIWRPWEWMLKEDGGYGKTAVESSLAEGIRQTEKKENYNLPGDKEERYKR